MSAFGDYRIDAVRAVLVLDYEELFTSLVNGGIPNTNRGLIATRTQLDSHTIVDLDEGRSANDLRPLVVPIEIVSAHIGYGLNEIGQATVAVEAGRDLNDMADGVADKDSSSPVHLIERYLTSRVRAKIYAFVTRNYYVGANTSGSDITGWPPPREPAVLFDGYLTSVARRSTPGDQTVIFQLSSFLSVLAESSTVTGRIAADSLNNLSFAPMMVQPLIQPVNEAAPASGFIATATGLAQLSIADSARFDLWGRWLKVEGKNVETYGIKGFLTALAQHDRFFWKQIQDSPQYASQCEKITAKQITNDTALRALKRIEPIFGPASTVTTAWSPNRFGRTVVQLIANANNNAVTRKEFIEADKANFEAVGYRYGVPAALKNSSLFNSSFTKSVGFAADIAYESVTTLGPSTMWDKLIGQYFPKYGLALAPMSTRAVVIPFNPTYNRVWQIVRSDEYSALDVKFDTPVEIRGAIVTSMGHSVSGILNPNAEAILGIYDNCKEGVFVVRRAPTWIINAAAPWNGGASVTANNNVRAHAAAPDDTARKAANAFAAAMGAVTEDAANKLQEDLQRQVQLLGHAFAKSVYQQEKLRSRIVNVSGRLRFDIGPGSVVKIETPIDRWVKLGLNLPDGYITGIVTRVQIVIDNKGNEPQVGTTFQLGFVRLEGEVASTPDLSTNDHPYWGTGVPGIPLVDSEWFRREFGDKASLVE